VIDAADEAALASVGNDTDGVELLDESRRGAGPPPAGPRRAQSVGRNAAAPQEKAAWAPQEKRPPVVARAEIPRLPVAAEHVPVRQLRPPAFAPGGKPPGRRRSSQGRIMATPQTERATAVEQDGPIDMAARRRLLRRRSSGHDEVPLSADPVEQEPDTGDVGPAGTVSSDDSSSGYD
jgi:hypothetical protein